MLSQTLGHWLRRPAHSKPASRRRGQQVLHAAADILEGRQLLSATLWVDPSSHHAGDFHTIQSAVDAASSGDTIKVAPGSYHESVTVAKSVTIVGGQVHRAGESGGSTVQSDGIAFSVSANSVTIKAFTISSAPTVPQGQGLGMFVINSTGSAFDKDTFKEPGGIGLFFAGGVNNSEVANNTFSFSTEGQGIEIGHTLGAVGNNNNQVKHNLLSNSGIVIDNLSSGNVITSNTIQNGDFGIQNGGIGTLISKNIITGESEAAILDASITAVTINANILNSDGMGIQAEPNGSITVINNTVNGSRGIGVSVIGTHSITVSNNTVSANRGGIQVFGGSVTAKNNVTNGNLGSGLIVVADGTLLSRNVANNNGDLGIQVIGSAPVVNGNTANANGTSGIFVQGVGATISNNTANANKGTEDFNDAGFVISGNDDMIRGNTGSGNAGYGLLFDHLDNSAITGNTANSNGFEGITLSNSSFDTVSGNTLMHDRNGIEVSGTSVGDTFADNTIA